VADIRVFVNGRGLDLAGDATALGALRASDPDEAEAVDRGERAITDSRGLPVEPDDRVFAGAIYRTVRARPTA
jgi:hypothetical protein